MKKFVFTAFAIYIGIAGIGQKEKKTEQEKLLAELSENSCKCIDSIHVSNKAKDEIAKEINRCIMPQVGAYQLGKKLMDLDSLKETAVEKDGKKEINISLALDENSKEYKEIYYEIERYLMDSCKAIKDKIAANDKQSKKSMSDNPKALELYYKGVDESKSENHEKAIDYFEKAIAIDPEFAFAWDNIGITYRKLGNYDKALNAYKRSLEIDPNGLMPLQNIAIVYRFKKDYDNAIAAYNRLAEIDKDNPEVYFGIGQIYAAFINDYEKGLDHMCKAYNLYIKQKSPYRTDAEKIIQFIYSEMKKKGKEDRFFEILKEHNISSQ